MTMNAVSTVLSEGFRRLEELLDQLGVEDRVVLEPFCGLEHQVQWHATHPDPI